VKVHKPDFSIIAMEQECTVISNSNEASNNGPWLFDTGAVPTIAPKAVELVTIKPVSDTLFTLSGSIKIKPNFSLVAIDSSAAPPELAIDAQLLLIQDKVNRCCFLCVLSYIVFVDDIKKIPTTPNNYLH
jgi:hypothetical protein